MTTPIASTSPQTITRRRYAAQTYGADRRQNRGIPSDDPVVAVVAPASPREVKLLPEGQRTSDVKTVLCYSDLRVGDQHAALPEDELVIDGVVYAVRKVLAEHPALAFLPRSWQVLAVRRPELPTVGGP